MGWKSGKVIHSPSGGWEPEALEWRVGEGGRAEVRLEKGCKKGSLPKRVPKKT